VSHAVHIGVLRIAIPRQDYDTSRYC